MAGMSDNEGLETISSEELAHTREIMNLTALKQRPVAELVDLAESMGLENLARSRKQDIIFSVLKAHAAKGEDIYGDGVLEILQDGFGFLRSADSSYLAGPDDIYVSPSQIRRFNMRTGDSVSGLIRPPKESERYFALLKVGEINTEAPEAAKHKVLFENLTPLHPAERIEEWLALAERDDFVGLARDLMAAHYDPRYEKHRARFAPEREAVIETADLAVATLGPVAARIADAVRALPTAR
jgi:transcription termination factor Rho